MRSSEASSALVDPIQARYSPGVTPTPITKHPAKFSEPILRRLEGMLAAERSRVRKAGLLPGLAPLLVLDPFAGVGRIHQLARKSIRTTGIEIEAEWAACHRNTVHADMFEWLNCDEHDGRWDVIATSPTYGNRFADHHNAQDGSTRRSYTHDIGHELHPNNSGWMHWGPKYWAFHARAYPVMLRALTPGGLLLLNVSDFYKGQQLVPAVAWHRGAAMGAGFVHGGNDARIETDRLQGVGTEDTSARAPFEVILRLRRPELS
jgi:hypothetical protein